MDREIMTINEFADHCNCPTSTIYTYVNRKFIVKTASGSINIINKTNKKFIENRRKIDAKKNGVEFIPDQLKPKDAASNKTTKRKRSEPLIKKNSIEDWKRKKIIADSRKAEHDADLRKVQLEKAMGKVIPVELLNQILKMNVQGIFIRFEQELQNLASVYCDILAGGDRKKLAELIDAMRVELERIIKITGKNVKQEVDNAVEEFTETRTRGESKIL